MYSMVLSDHSRLAMVELSLLLLSPPWPMSPPKSMVSSGDWYTS
ncbi:Uncharacterised protein [Bordetella pertussis]|nr:Uncharacterised protein [Bordetella pertussis]CPO25505.1 Uncharacterised protein [Bordetella pertussis]CPO38333.1 Uncharacterised protein [Bordetella pertussis]CPP09210.1 Uncharacterised protein [Bordetella pertussis]